uniref:Uncharacterized protein n=1 Tax=Rhizophora mucronata TaxID=61149 RepID=A0A2P2Q0P5_RHIMU
MSFFSIYIFWCSKYMFPLLKMLFWVLRG